MTLLALILLVLAMAGLLVPLMTILGIALLAAVVFFTWADAWPYWVGGAALLTVLSVPAVRKEQRIARIRAARRRERARRGPRRIPRSRKRARCLKCESEITSYPCVFCGCRG